MTDREPADGAVDVHAGIPAKSLETIVRRQYMYSMVGLVVGVIFILAGVFLLVQGISGQIQWTVKISGVSSSISNAAPGAILFIVGLGVVFLTRYVVKVRK